MDGKWKGYRQAEQPPYMDKKGFTLDGLEFKVGDRIIDDCGYIGYIAHIGSKSTDPNGKIYAYSALVRYEWDSPAYGLERYVRDGEFSTVDANGEIVREF